MGPKKIQAMDVATSGAKAARKPLAVLVLAEDELRSHTLLRALTGLADDEAVWARLAFEKGDETLKRWKVALPGALVLLDPTSDPPALIKVVRSFAPAVLKKEIQEAAKALGR